MQDTYTRREYQQAAGAAFLSGLFGWGDDDEEAEDGSPELGDVSFLEGFGVAQNGAEVEKGPDWLDLVVNVTKTTKGVELEFTEDNKYWKGSNSGSVIPADSQPLDLYRQILTLAA